MSDPKTAALVLAEAAKAIPSLLSQIYGDIAQPGVQQVGKALKTVLGLGNTVLMPVQLLNELGEITIKHNLHKYRKKIEALELNDVINVPSEIGVPILEALAYVRDENLSDLFTNLLLQASTVKGANKAHPSFVKLLEKLSPDEAIIINTLDLNSAIPALRVKLTRTDLSGSRYSVPVIELQKKVILRFTENFAIYLDNLESCGLLKVDFTEEIVGTDVYESTIKAFEEDFKNTPTDVNQTKEWQRGVVRITPLGVMFIEAVTLKKFSKYSR